MAYRLPPIAVTGQIITAAWGNDARDSLVETAKLFAYFPARGADVPIGQFMRPATLRLREVMDAGWASELLFDDSEDTAAIWTIPVPWLAVAAPRLTFIVRWLSLVETTGSAVWDLSVGFFGAGDTFPQAGTIARSATAPAPANATEIDETNFAQLTATGATNDIMVVRLTRDADNAADTLVGDAHVLDMLAVIAP